jgi:WS/DGAT/MGAT family acyltransferase
MSRAGHEHVGETDAFTFQLERDPLLRSTIVAVATFDRTPEWDLLNDRIERATRLAPIFRERLVPGLWHLSPPRWVPDPDFDLSWHVRRARVRTGGGFEAVLAFARNAGMAAFDHDRPLWEFTLLEGLPDGRAALVMKVHHALTDGIGGIQIAAHVVDLEREPPALGAMPNPPAGRRVGPFDALTDAAAFNADRAKRAVCDVLGGVRSTVVGSLRRPIGTARDVTATASSIARFVRPITTTASPVMRARRLLWRYDALDIPLEPLHESARAAHCTLNDAFLAALAGGLSRYHEAHGAPTDGLRVTMPISIRTPDDPEGGNKITLTRFQVPIGIPDPAERMAAIGELCRDARADRAIPYSNVVAAALNLLPVAVTGGMLKHVDFLASNVPGFDRDVYVAGARLESFHAFGPTLGSAANITLMSYRATCHIGINTDAGAVPDVGLFLECLRHGFDEVLTLAS